MTREDDSAAPSWVVVEFAARYVEDREIGQRRTLSEYLGLYPGEESGITAEFHRLEREHAIDTRPLAVNPFRGPAAGTSLGQYLLIEELGRGGQATVWLAEDEELGRRVALKVLDARGPASEEALERLEREARSVARLRHPGICAVHDLGRDGAVAWMAMQYVEGETVAARLQRLQAHRAETREESPSSGPTTSQSRRGIESWVAFFAQVGRALEVAHAAGLVHRDLKPSNLMIAADGSPVILDFGLVHDAQADQALTRTGDVFGTYAYMSPEQIEGRSSRVDAGTDVWALGVSLYECLTLERPFEAPSRTLQVQAILTRDPPDPRARNPLIARDLAVIIETALEKDRTRRYASAAHLADDLQRFLERHPIHARPAGPFTRLRRLVRRHPLPVASVAATLLVLVAALGLTLHLLDASRTAEKQAQRQFGKAQAERARADHGFNEIRRVLQTLVDRLDRVTAEHTGSPQLRVEACRAIIAALDSTRTVESDPTLHAVLLARVHTGAGDALGNPHGPNLGRPEEALAHYRMAENALEGRLLRDSARGDLLRALALVRLRKATLLLREGRDLGEAGVAAASSRDLLRDLARQEQADSSEREISLALEIQAMIADAEGDPTRASELIEETLAIKSKLLEQDPGDFERQRDHALITSKLAALRLQTGPEAAAEMLLRESLELSENLAEDHPQQGAIVWIDLREARRALATLLAARGELAEAAELMDGAVAASRELVRGAATSRSHREGLAGDLEDAARLRGPLGEGLAARRLRMEAACVRAEASDAEVALLRESARLHLDVRPAELRDPMVALGCARRAAGMTRHQDPNILLLLAEAAVESGRLSEGRRALEDAAALLGSDPPSDLAERLDTLRKRCGLK